MGVALSTLGFAASAGVLEDVHSDAADMRGELSRELKSFQQAHDCKGVLSLYYTDGMEADRKESFMQNVTDNYCSNFDQPITSVAFASLASADKSSPDDYKGRHSVYTLDPVGALVVDYGAGEPGKARSVSFRYGIHDHKAYLITTKNADAK